MNDFIDLQRLIVIILRRWWLLVVVTALAALLGYTISQRQPRVYRATTTVLVGQIFQSTNLDRQDLLTSELVAQTYSNMVRRQPILQAVVDSLGLVQSWQQLRSQVSVDVMEGTQLIQITVEADSPSAAQTIADEVARQMILFDPTGGDPEVDAGVRLFVQQQLENLQARIDSGQSKLTSLESEMVTAESAEQLSELQGEANTLEGLITNWENTYAQLLGFLQTGQSPNTLTVIEPAQADPKPVRPQVQMIVFLGGGLGAFLALGLIFLLEYLDDTYKTPEEITREFGLPVIGFINETGKYGDRENASFVSRHPRSPIAEAYRSLRANLEFVGVDQPLNTILVSSFNAGVGKSSLATNLAIVIAQGEKDVTLVDADLRKSSIHRLAGLPNNVGLSDVFRNGMDVTDVRQIWESERIGVITGGTIPPNPSELLGSKKMDDILARLEEISDVTIIDSPPFVVSDALLLAARVDGVLLVIRPGLTRRKFARTMMEQLHRAGVRVLGVALNRIPSKGAEYYGEYQYFSSYYDNGHYSGEEDIRSEATAKEPKLKIAVKKLFRLANPGLIKQKFTKNRERNRTNIINEEGPLKHVTVYLRKPGQDVFNIKGDKD